MRRETDLGVLIKRSTPQDIIAAIFAYSDLKTFTNDQRRIQTFVHENKIGEFAELLKPFVFSEGVDVYPYSRLLESVLTGLRLGGIIFTWSPKEDSYNMEEGIRNKEKGGKGYQREVFSRTNTHSKETWRKVARIQ